MMKNRYCYSTTVIDTDHYFQLACYWYVPIAPASDAAAIGRM